jgi:predicted phosphoadenosine phosphosulfate sulfurtransferase
VKIYRKENVLDSSLERMRWLFDEFPNVVVSMSGGKDSTVVFELARMVAHEKNRLPLRVFWLDQECEFQSTVDYMSWVMREPDVEPWWFQIPFRENNATSATEHWLTAWGEGEEWVREKDPLSRKENVYGTDRFVRLMEAIVMQEFKDTPTAALTGVRAEESPTRFMSATSQATYQSVTWGNRINETLGHYNFHPIYDWSYLDIWKAIHDHGWHYNAHYDAMHRYGVPVRKMRVSNYHHETAVHALFMLQEIEPETWERATRRLSGLATAGHLGKDDYFVYELPFMFKDWEEYRDYLLEHLTPDDIMKERYRKKFASMARRYPHEVGPGLYRVQINSILTNDVDMVKLSNWESVHFTTARLAEKEGYGETVE